MVFKMKYLVCFFCLFLCPDIKGSNNSFNILFTDLQIRILTYDLVCDIQYPWDKLSFYYKSKLPTVCQEWSRILSQDNLLKLLSMDQLAYAICLGNTDLVVKISNQTGDSLVYQGGREYSPSWF